MIVSTERKVAKGRIFAALLDGLSGKEERLSTADCFLGKYTRANTSWKKLKKKKRKHMITITNDTL